MYLKNIVIKNIGPISELSVELPFNENGTPKPLLFVGENGSGKTFLQSQIVDSLYEIGSNLFSDISKGNSLERSYYKISGGVNLKSGSDKGFSLLSYKDNENKKIEYLDKIGLVTKEEVIDTIKSFSLTPNTKSDNQKILTTIADEKKDKLRNEWMNGVHFYQPAYRYEEPMWKNNVFRDETRFEDNQKFSGKLGKELEVISANKINKSYLLDLVLDVSMYSDNTIDNILLDSINKVLRKIKKMENIRFGIGPRGQYRVAIGEMDKDGKWIKEILPSIDGLSLGESILLNLFINIIRHGDTPPKTHKEISGIVAIDEIDVHLHSDLQNTVLPELIKLFPKVQFIITTHSPLFILGMKREFGEDGFEIRNMPRGEVITTERFSEFENAYNILKNTEKFEKDIKTEIEKINKPILYVEDEYYQIYQIAYLKLNDIECDEHNFKEKFDNEAYFTIYTGKSAGGVAGLLRVKDISIFEDKKIVGLWDFDREGRENFYHISKESFWGKEEGNLETGFYKKRSDHPSIYALLLPIPDRLKKLASLEWENFISYVEIENLLPEKFLIENNFVDEKEAPGKIKYYKCKKTIKNRLWKKLFELDKESFIDFKNIFNFLDEKIRVTE